MFVVELAGLQAVVKLAEEFVEQVSLGLRFQFRRRGGRRSGDARPARRAAMPEPRSGRRRPGAGS